eukprot:TRINITY_DN23398_c0_g3_i2.p1 TRINITY_DN23398_c0_g3~~TRINITY_DN23398_c0_g3_i2.p1  ORF type:complete len:286 (+),score=47.68 TRINITY_DN23398_c0_g3_i2:41-859(+)
MAPPSLALASRLGWSSLRSLCTRVPLSHAVPSRPTRPSPTPSSVLLACRQIETHCTMEALTTGVNVSHGHVQLIIGPMFSGKSTELLRRIRRYTYSRRRCLVIKYRKDTRYSADCMATHDRQSISAHPCEQLSEVESIVSNYDVVGVDEGQFYPDIAEWAEEQANRGKVVIVAALDGTFQRKPFGRVLDLIPLSESVTKLTAVCQICGQDASFSKRIGSETAVEVIGGAEKYLPVCRTCFHRPATTLTAEKLAGKIADKEVISIGLSVGRQL